MTEIRIIEQGVTLKIASYSPIGVMNEGDLDPANMSSGSATVGQVPVADGSGGVDWSDESGLGDVTGPAGDVVDSGVAVYSGTTGKVIKKPVAAVDFNAQAITNVGAVAGHVQTSRQIIDGTGISGGGDLSADRTLSVDQSALDPANMGSGSATDGYVATADGLGGVAWEAGGGGGGGDVTGPGSSTDHALARWDSTGGDTLLNSGVTLSDAGAMVFPSGGSISKPSTGAASEAFGSGALAGGDNALAVGTSGVTAGGTNSTAIGSFSEAGNTLSTALGRSAKANGQWATACGPLAEARADGSICLGRSAIVIIDSPYGMALGYAAQVRGGAGYSIAIGRYTEVTTNNTYGIAMGDNCFVNHDYGMCFGRSAVSTAANRATFGTIGGSYDMELQCGKGFACFGATPPGSQPAKINDPSGGVTVDSQARTAINSIINVLEGAGLSAAT